MSEFAIIEEEKLARGLLVEWLHAAGHATRSPASDDIEAPDMEFRIRHPDCEWHCLKVRRRFVRDPSRAILRVAGSAIDVTARMNAEAEREWLELELRQAPKAEAMSTLAGGIAHEFNNILGAILGYGELAQKAAPDGGVLQRYLDNVMHAGSRAKAFVDRIVAFNRNGPVDHAPFNVQAVIGETVALVAASLPFGVRLEQRLEARDAAIIGDATQLHQVALNLCTTAVRAMKNGGVLRVDLDRTEIARDCTVSHAALVPGPYVRLRVSDTGSRIQEQVIHRMFDPFFTTKGVGEGNGLGTSLVHGIVANLSGAIDVRTAVDQGTAITIWLPMVDDASESSPDDGGELPCGQGQAVLIVDDEPALVEIAEEMLAELGYEPVGFRSSVAALDAFRDTPERFAIVLTDETMPVLSGTVLAETIRELRPGVPIVLMSGYVGAQIQKRARTVGIDEILRKPLNSRDIAKCIARFLHSVDRCKAVPS